MWQIYFQSNLNLFSAGSSVQTLIQGRIICIYLFPPLLFRSMQFSCNVYVVVKSTTTLQFHTVWHFCTAYVCHLRCVWSSFPRLRCNTRKNLLNLNTISQLIFWNVKCHFQGIYPGRKYTKSTNKMEKWNCGKSCYLVKATLAQGKGAHTWHWEKWGRSVF